MIKRIALVGALALGLTACGGGFQAQVKTADTKVTDVKAQALDNVQMVIAGLLDKADADLAQGDAEALAATPPDEDFHTCAVSARLVAGAVKKVATAGNNRDKGVIAQAEFFSLFAPGSEQYEWVKGQLISGCSAKITKTMNRIANATTTLAALPKLLGLATPIATGAIGILPVIP